MSEDDNKDILPPYKNHDDVVKFQVENTHLEVDLNNFEGLFNDLNKYNDQFSLGQIMFRSTFMRFESPVSEESDNQQIDAFFLISKHQDVAEKLGLSLQPVIGKTGSVFTEQGMAEAGEMRINVINHQRFTNFLENLQPEQLKEATKKGLIKLTKILSMQIYDNYDLQAPSEEAVQLFMGMEKIVSEYKRLGMDKEVEIMDEYLSHGKKGDLREHIAVKRYRLLSEPGDGHFGPGDWQGDSNADQLGRRWHQALNVLYMSKNNPNAQEYYQKLSQHLKKCAEFAMTKLSGDEKPRNWEDYPQMMEKLRIAKQWVEKVSDPNYKKEPLN